MSDILFWVYVVNSALLIVHEIDSAYWKEWELLRLPGGISAFNLIHLPLVILIMYGGVLIQTGAFLGLMISILLGLFGPFEFTIHVYFIRKGDEKFGLPVSRAILLAALITSIIQLWLTLQLI